MNHPALVKTSDQPLFSSVSVSPFTSDEALRASDISLVPSLNLQQILWWNSKENKGSPYRNFVGSTQKWKSDSPLNSKPIDIHRMLFLVLKKEIREGFAGIKLRLTLHQIRTLTYLFLSLTIRRKKRNKTLTVCSALVVNLKTTMEKSRYDVRNLSDGRAHIVLVWRKILFESCQG